MFYIYIKNQCYVIIISNHYSSLTRSALAWIGSTSVNGVNFHPSALKNLFWNSTHCRRNACKKHSIVSIPMMTPNVMLNHKNIPITIVIALAPWIPPPIVFSKNTFDNCPWANDNAQRRRYEAVFEIEPKTNSIVSMIWWTATSLISSWWSPDGFSTTAAFALETPSSWKTFLDLSLNYWLSWADSFESFKETRRFSSWIFSWAWWWGLCYVDLVLSQIMKGLGMSIHGTQIREIISKLYWSAYWLAWSHKGFPSVDPILRGSAIICPIIEGASEVSLSVPQLMVHL